MAFLVAAGAFLVVTPPGALDKVDAVGYAVCHRIESHSFVIAGRQLPLCARCTGIYQGAALTLIALAVGGRGRATRLPSWKLLVVLGLFVAAMGVDGINSYLGFFHGLLPQLYPSQNWLRLMTGTLDGVAMAVVVLPMFNNTFWRNPDPSPVVQNIRELAGLVLLAGLSSALVLTEAPVLLVPVALLSVAGLLAMLAAVNTTIVLILGRCENRVATPRAALWAVLAGLAGTFAMVAAIDVVRFAVTGTWGGLPL